MQEVRGRLRFLSVFFEAFVQYPSVVMPMCSKIELSFAMFDVIRFFNTPTVIKPIICTGNGMMNPYYVGRKCENGLVCYTPRQPTL